MPAQSSNTWALQLFDRDHTLALIFAHSSVLFVNLTISPMPRPILLLANLRTVAHDPAPATSTREARFANKARIAANDCMQRDLQQHVFQNLRVQQVRQRTIPKFEQTILVLAQPARWCNKPQSRRPDASVLKQSDFEVACCSTSGQKGFPRLAAEHPDARQQRHSGEHAARHIPK